MNVIVDTAGGFVENEWPGEIQQSTDASRCPT
jgi:hypothetical protein